MTQTFKVILKQTVAEGFKNRKEAEKWAFDMFHEDEYQTIQVEVEE